MDRSPTHTPPRPTLLNLGLNTGRVYTDVNNNDDDNGQLPSLDNTPATENPPMVLAAPQPDRPVPDNDDVIIIDFLPSDDNDDSEDDYFLPLIPRTTPTTRRPLTPSATPVVSSGSTRQRYPSFVMNDPTLYREQLLFEEREENKK